MEQDPASQYPTSTDCSEQRETQIILRKVFQGMGNSEVQNQARDSNVWKSMGKKQPILPE
jgi:hypothetical protein